MNYISAHEASAKWGVSLQTVTSSCAKSKIEGAYKDGKYWRIPDIERPSFFRASKAGKEFRFIDLFCGVGGFHQAMEALGGKCVFASDINASCREVYKTNYCPNDEFPVWGDVIDAIKQNVIPEFDVLCGGFPCQTFSKAGNQNGFRVVEKEDGGSDERGQLFYRIIDILKAHPECKYVVLENVRNLADKKENWAIICKELKEQGFIITEEPIIASPHQYGIPQVRERVFILGIKKTVFDKRRKLPKGYLTHEVLNIASYLSPLAVTGNCLDDVLDEVVDAEYCVPDEIEEVLNIWEEFRANVVGLASPFWIHKAGIGIYDRTEYENDPEIGFQQMPEWKKALVMKSRIMYENNYEFIDNWLERHHMRDRILLHQKFEWNCGSDCETIKDGIIQIRQSGVRVKRPNYFPSLVVMRNTPIVWDERHGHFRYITPREASRLQSFNENFIFSELDSTSYQQLGNSVNVELVRIFSQELFKLGKNSKQRMGG